MDIQPGTITRDDIYARECEGILAQQLGEEFAVLDVNNGEYFRLNEVGAKVWNLLLDGESLRSVLRAIESAYDVPEDRLTTDLSGLLTDIQTRGLLEFYAKEAS